MLLLIFLSTLQFFQKFCFWIDHCPFNSPLDMRRIIGYHAVFFIVVPYFTANPAPLMGRSLMIMTLSPL